MRGPLVALLLARVAQADGSVLIVPLEGEKKDVRAVEKQLSKALAKARKNATISTRTMAQLQEAAGCHEDSPPCLTSVGQQAGADQFIFGSVFRERKTLRVLLRRFSVTTGQEEGQAGAAVRRISKRGMAKLVSALFRRAKPVPAGTAPGTVVGTPLFGALEVQSALPEVLILVNGQPRGSAPLRLDDIGAATYDLEAEKPGYRTWRGQAVVEGGKVTTVRVSLEALPEQLRAEAKASARGFRAKTWVAAGVTGALLIGAAIFATSTVSAQNDFDQDVEALDATDPMASQRAVALEDRADSGERKALVANVLFAATGAAAILTGVFVALDLTDDDGATTTSVMAHPTGLTVRF